MHGAEIISTQGNLYQAVRVRMRSLRRPHPRENNKLLNNFKNVALKEYLHKKKTSQVRTAVAY